MKDRRHLLKIKIKSLAAEARIIRKEERKRKVREGLISTEVLAQMDEAVLADTSGADKAKVRARWMRNWQRSRRKEYAAKPWFGDAQSELQALYLHRTLVVRHEARAAALAYGFIRGRTLEQLEGPRRLIGEETYKLPGEHMVTHADFGAFDKAARLVTTYGPFSLSKADATRDFFAWVKQRNLALTYDSGWPALTLQNRSNDASGLLDGPTDNVAAQTKLDDVPQLDVLHLGDTGSSPAKEASND